MQGIVSISSQAVESVCVSEGETEGSPPRAVRGVSAVYIPHIPAANWIRTMAFLVESSFIVLLESYMDGGLVLLSHALLFGLWVCFFSARGSFIRFWLHVGNTLKMDFNNINSNNIK